MYRLLKKGCKNALLSCYYADNFCIQWVDPGNQKTMTSCESKDESNWAGWPLVETAAKTWYYRIQNLLANVLQRTLAKCKSFCHYISIEALAIPRYYTESKIYMHTKREIVKVRCVVISYIPGVLTRLNDKDKINDDAHAVQMFQSFCIHSPYFLSRFPPSLWAILLFKTLIACSQSKENIIKR